jgi:hypothetical protein
VACRCVLQRGVSVPSTHSVRCACAALLTTPATHPGGGTMQAATRVARMASVFARARSHAMHAWRSAHQLCRLAGRRHARARWHAPTQMAASRVACMRQRSTCGAAARSCQCSHAVHPMGTHSLCHHFVTLTRHTSHVTRHTITPQGSGGGHPGRLQGASWNRLLHQCVEPAPQVSVRHCVARACGDCRGRLCTDIT